MNEISQTKKIKHQVKKRKHMSLRLKITVTSIITFCISCAISYGVMARVFKLLYDGPMGVTEAVVLCIISCLLSMLIGGLILWHGAGSVTKPILKVIEGVKQVAEGDFSVQLHIERNHMLLKNLAHKDEIDDLALDFNKMVRELQGMDYMRKDFMSNVSHEINTPVAAITGFSEILLDGGLDKEEELEYLAYLNRESIRLARLCENMLSMSRLDNQVIVDRNKQVKVDEQLRRCIIMLQEKWTHKEVNFDLELSKCSIASNADLLYQVWTNLIDNAVKFSKAGGTVYISASVEEDQLMVLIKDEGVGINPEKQKRIFDKFYQADESHKNQGSGLGLSIVKRIIELLQGSISCESVEGQGTTMRVVLPNKL